MNRLGKQLLAGSALPFNQHCTVGLRDPLGKCDLPLHIGIVRDDFREPVVRFEAGQLIDLFAHLPGFPDRE
ncbi:hypothetical protein D3C78_1902280 [compost metagenome]